MNILAIDPATKCGWACGPLIGGTWNLTPKKGDHPGKRGYDLSRTLRACIGDGDYKIDLIVYERAIFMGASRARALAVQNGLVGIILATAHGADVPVEAFSASEIKKHATGKGNAKKPAMVAAMQRKYPQATIVDDNHADALALWDLAHHRHWEP